MVLLVGRWWCFRKDRSGGQDIASKLFLRGIASGMPQPLVESHSALGQIRFSAAQPLVVGMQAACRHVEHRGSLSHVPCVQLGV